MTAVGLFVNLLGQGFTLAPNGDGVRVRPASRLTPELRQAVTANRDALLRLLDLRELFEERVLIARYDGGLPWDQAEGLALAEAIGRAESMVHHGHNAA